MNLIESCKSPLGKLRVLGLIEGLSFVLLVGLAMPLKYGLGMPIFVRILGPIHGVLFVGLCAEILKVVFGKGWPIARGAVVFGASLFPLGPFLIDGWLKKQQAEFDGPQSS